MAVEEGGVVLSRIDVPFVGRGLLVEQAAEVLGAAQPDVGVADNKESLQGPQRVPVLGQHERVVLAVIRLVPEKVRRLGVTDAPQGWAAQPDEREFVGVVQRDLDGAQPAHR